MVLYSLSLLGIVIEEKKPQRREAEIVPGLLDSGGKRARGYLPIGAKRIGSLSATPVVR